MLTPEPLRKIKDKKARHKKEHLQIGAENSVIHKTNKGFNFVPVVSVILNYRTLRQMFAFKNGPFHPVFPYVNFNKFYNAEYIVIILIIRTS